MKTKDSIRNLIIKISKHPNYQFFDDEEDYCKVFWKAFSRKLTPQQRKYLKRYPEFIREVIFEHITIQNSEIIAKELLLSRADW